MRALGWVAAVLVAASCGAAARAGTPAVYSGTSGNWNVGSKWLTNPTVPLDGGGNLYDVSISNVSVTYNVAGSNAVESLGLTGATLSLSSGDSLSVVNGLTASKLTIDVDNAAFSAGSTSSIDSTNLTATNGGTINLPVTAFTATQGTTWQASGTGSVVQLPDLTSVSYAGTSLTVSAQSGGIIQLPALTGVSATGTLSVSATGAGSQVNLPAVGTAVSGLTVTESGGGTVNWGSPTTVQASSITLDAASTLNTAALTNIDSTSITVNGPGTFSVPLIGAMLTVSGTGATLQANAGATLNLPNVMAITNPGNVSDSLTFLASGTGSKVTMDAVTTITNNAAGIAVEAQSGGYLEMTALTTVNNLGSIFGSFTASADGANSKVELPALATIHLVGQSDTISATNGGTVDAPALASVTNTGNVFEGLTIVSTGAGSVVHVPLLGNSPQVKLSVTVGTGAAVLWGSPTVVQASSITLDTSGTIALAQLTNVDSTSLTASGGATINLPLVAAFSTVTGTGATIQANAGSTITLPAAASITTPGGGLTFVANGAGATVLLDAVTTITGNASGVAVEAQSGGYLEMTALTTVNNLGSIFGGFTALADGTNSKVELPALTTLHLVGQSDEFSATKGGRVDVPALGTVTNTGNVFEGLTIVSTGAGSVVNVPLLGNSAQVKLTVTVGTGGTLLWGSPAIVQASSITLQDSSGTITLGQLTNIDSTSLTASGGASINLPLVTAYSAVTGTGATIQANAGSTITLPAVASITNPGNVFDGLTFVANGAGAKVAMDAVTTVTSNAASITFEAESGGLLEMTALQAGQNLGSIFGSFNAYASGAGSRVSMPALTTLQLFGQTDNLRATAGGYLDMHSLRTVTSTGDIFENLSVQSTGTGSVVNVSGLLSTVGFPDSFAIGSGGEVLFGALERVGLRVVQCGVHECHGVAGRLSRREFVEEYWGE